MLFLKEFPEALLRFEKDNCMNIKRAGVVIANSLVGFGLLALVGCASSTVPKDTQQADSAITSVIRDSLQTNDNVKAKQVEVQTREGVVCLNGVVDTKMSQGGGARRVAHRGGGWCGERSHSRRADGRKLDRRRDGMRSTVKSKLIANSEIKAGDIDVSSLPRGS